MQIQTFNCPQCGAPIEFKGGPEKTVTCPFCSSSVIVPKELRETAVQPQIVMSTMDFDNKAVRRGLFGLTGATLALVLIPAIIACIGLIIGVVAMFGGLAAATNPEGIGQAIENLATESAPTPTEGYASLALSFGGEGTGPGLMEDARSIAVDPQGNIYVAEYIGGRIQEFDSNGKFVTQLLVDPKDPLPAIAVDRSGILYVAQGGKILRFRGASGSPLTDVTYPPDLYFEDTSVTPDGGLITFVWNSRDDFIVLGSDGSVKRTLEGAISTVSGDSELDAKVAMDGLGNIYALGTFNNAVFKFGPDGKFINRFGSDGDEPGQFTAPSAVAVDGHSHVYVTDFKGVQVFDQDGRYLGVFDVTGAASGMAFDDQGALYVVARTMVYKFIVP